MYVYTRMHAAALAGRTEDHDEETAKDAGPEERPVDFGLHRKKREHTEDGHGEGECEQNL